MAISMLQGQSGVDAKDYGPESGKYLLTDCLQKKFADPGLDGVSFKPFWCD